MNVNPHFSIALSLLTTLLIGGAARAQTQTTTRISLDSGGAQVNGYNVGPSVSADGRFVVFRSDAPNLVAGDTNGAIDIFVRDRTNGTTERVSVATGGAEGNSDSFGRWTSISADGRFVAFESFAWNLVANDTNATFDIFVRDRTSGTTELVSVDSAGVQGNYDSGGASISPDGRFVAFNSNASNLVAGDTNGFADIFVRDRTAGTTERVSVATGGTQGNADSIFMPAISADGRFVAFGSNASNLVAGDTNGAIDIFVRDRTSGTTERVNLGLGGAQANSASAAPPTISADGRFVAFDSGATNLVPGDTNGAWDYFVRDRLNGTTERVSVATGGAQANGDSTYSGVISADGRCVAFGSSSSNLVAGDTNATWDIFVHDRVLGTTERASVSTSGAQGNLGSYFYPSISADGLFVAFDSLASTLVAGDTNGNSDVFVRDRGYQGPVVYCTSGTSSNGCSASIAAGANPSLSLANACNITVASVEGQKSGLLFYGVDNAGFTPGPWASGSTSWLCVKHPTQRTPIQNSGGTINMCNGSFVLDWNAYQSTHPFSLGNPWSIGDKVYVQTWFRDPLAVKSTNLSNAVEMTYGP